MLEQGHLFFHQNLRQLRRNRTKNPQNQLQGIDPDGLLGQLLSYWMYLPDILINYTHKNCRNLLAIFCVLESFHLKLFLILPLLIFLESFIFWFQATSGISSLLWNVALHMSICPRVILLTDSSDSLHRILGGSLLLLPNFFCNVCMDVAYSCYIHWNHEEIPWKCKAEHHSGERYM